MKLRWYMFVASLLSLTGLWAQNDSPQWSIQEVLEMQIRNKMPLSNVKDRKIRKIIKKATDKKQGSRYQSASEFRVALDAPEPTMQYKKYILISIIALGGYYFRCHIKNAHKIFINA